MSEVLISKAAYTNEITKETTSSKTYHSIKFLCGNAKKISAENRFLVEEDIAKAFGRTYCKSCIDKQERIEAKVRLDALVEDILGESNIDLIAAELPKNFELRLYLLQDGKKQPMKVWTSNEHIPDT